MGDFPLWLNALVFAIAAATIWWAGIRLEHVSAVIARQTGLGHEFTGMLLLAGATSLPEVATTVTAVVVLDNPTLAVHNLLGGVALQTLLLVVADAVKRKRGALTFFSPRFVLLIEGVGLLSLLAVTTAGVAARGMPTVFSTSLWLLALAATYVALTYLVYRSRGQQLWTPTRADEVPSESQTEGGEAGDDDGAGKSSAQRALLRFAGLSGVVLAGGWLATHTAEGMAEQTGLGSAFMGATLLALATSLPELSTTTAAARSGRYSTAISNVFGSNAFDVALLFLAEVLYRKGTILGHAASSVVFVAALGAFMTCIFLWGLMERENRTILGVGWDSAAASLVYAGGVAVLYFM